MRRRSNSDERDVGGPDLFAETEPAAKSAAELPAEREGGRRLSIDSTAGYVKGDGVGDFSDGVSSSVGSAAAGSSVAGRSLQEDLESVAPNSGPERRRVITSRDSRRAKQNQKDASQNTEATIMLLDIIRSFTSAEKRIDKELNELQESSKQTNQTSDKSFEISAKISALNAKKTENNQNLKRLLSLDELKSSLPNQLIFSTEADKIDKEIDKLKKIDEFARRELLTTLQRNQQIADGLLAPQAAGSSSPNLLLPNRLNEMVQNFGHQTSSQNLDQKQKFFRQIFITSLAYGEGDNSPSLAALLSNAQKLKNQLEDVINADLVIFSQGSQAKTDADTLINFLGVELQRFVQEAYDEITEKPKFYEELSATNPSLGEKKEFAEDEQIKSLCFAKNSFSGIESRLAASAGSDDKRSRTLGFETVETYDINEIAEKEKFLVDPKSTTLGVFVKVQGIDLQIEDNQLGPFEMNCLLVRGENEVVQKIYVSDKKLQKLEEETKQECEKSFFDFCKHLEAIENIRWLHGKISETAGESDDENIKKNLKFLASIVETCSIEEDDDLTTTKRKQDQLKHFAEECSNTQYFGSQISCTYSGVSSQTYTVGLSDIFNKYEDRSSTYEGIDLLGMNEKATIKAQAFQLAESQFGRALQEKITSNRLPDSIFKSLDETHKGAVAFCNDAINVSGEEICFAGKDRPNTMFIHLHDRMYLRVICPTKDGTFSVIGPDGQKQSREAKVGEIIFDHAIHVIGRDGSSESIGINVLSAKSKIREALRKSHNSNSADSYRSIVDDGLEMLKKGKFKISSCMDGEVKGSSVICSDNWSLWSNMLRYPLGQSDFSAKEKVANPFSTGESNQLWSWIPWSSKPKASNQNSGVPQASEDEINLGQLNNQTRVKIVTFERVEWLTGLDEKDFIGKKDGKHLMIEIDGKKIYVGIPFSSIQTGEAEPETKSGCLPLSSSPKPQILNHGIKFDEMVFYRIDDDAAGQKVASVIDKETDKELFEKACRALQQTDLNISLFRDKPEIQIKSRIDPENLEKSNDMLFAVIVKEQPKSDVYAKEVTNVVGHKSLIRDDSNKLVLRPPLPPSAALSPSTSVCL